MTLTVSDGSLSNTTTGQVNPSQLTQAGVAFVQAATTSGNRTAHRVQVPASVQAGDTMVLFLTTNSTTSTVNDTVAGWTLVQTRDGDGIRGRAWTRTATAADAGSNVTVTSSALTKSVLSVAAYRGVGGAHTAVSASASNVVNAAGTSHTTPAGERVHGRLVAGELLGREVVERHHVVRTSEQRLPHHRGSHRQRQDELAARRLERPRPDRDSRRAHRHHQCLGRPSCPVLLGDRTAVTYFDALGGDMTTHAQVPEVEVGPFWVSDSPRDELVDHVVELRLGATSRPAFAYALHVGGLNARRERDFVVAMRQADVVYADGGSVVWLAKLAGGNRVERAPTTDIGWAVMRGFARRVGRAPRVALIGGPAGLAERAGAVLEESGVAEIVLVDNGFHSDWTEPLARPARGRP